MRWADRPFVCAIFAMLQYCSSELDSHDGRRGSPSRVTRDAAKGAHLRPHRGPRPGLDFLALVGSAPRLPVLLSGRRRQRGPMVEESPGLLRVYSGLLAG